MRKRGLCCHPMSVCLSIYHVGTLYPEGWRYCRTLFSSRWPIIPVFYHKHGEFCNFWL